MSRRWVLVMLLGAALVLPAALSAYTQAPAGMLDRVQAAGVVNIGTRFQNPPASFINEAGEWVGFDVDFGDEIARRLGVQLERIQVDSTTRITFLEQGKIDMAVASMNHTRRRDDPIDFSVTYFWDGQSLLALKGRFTQVTDVSGKILAAVEGSSVIPNIQAYFAEKGLPPPEIKLFNSEAEALNGVRNGQADAFGQDSTLVVGIVAGDPAFEIFGEPFANVYYGVGVPENDSQWRDTINFIIQDIWDDGTYAAIYDKWFGPDAPFPFPLQGDMEIWEK